MNWKELIYTDGKIDESKVMNEKEFRERNLDKGITKDDVEAMIGRAKTHEELVEELITYFEI